MNKKRFLFSLLSFFAPFLFYLFHLAPTVTYGDSAEFVIGAYKLTIVHPTGYPSYLLLGKLFTFLPIGDFSYRVNLISAFFGALTCAILFLIILELTKSYPISFVSIFTLAFSLIFSHLSTIAEVYTLNTFFFSLLIYILLQWKKSGKKKFLFLLSFILGLSLTNHLTILIFFPSFLIFLLLNKSQISLKPLDYLKFLALFLLGLFPYLYIPIVSLSPSEIIFWPKIKSLKEFIMFVSGSHFKVWFLNQSLKELGKNILKFFSFLLIQFPGLATVFGAIGFLKCKKDKKEFVLLSLMFFSLFLFGINYKIEDIHHFYLPCHLIFSIWVGFGILWLWERTHPQKKYRFLFTFTLFLLFFLYIFTYQTLKIPIQVEKSYFFPDTSKMGLISTERDSVIICDWAYATLFRYWQMIHKIRKDVIIVFDYDENWLEYVEKLYGKRKLYLSRFEKGVGSKYYLIPENFIYKVEKNPPQFKAPNSKPQIFTNQVFFDSIVLIGYGILNKPEEREILSLDIYWKALKKTEKAYDVEIEIQDKKGRPLSFKKFRPVYGLYSTEKWKKGEILKERVNLYFPLKSSSFKIKFSISDKEERRSFATQNYP